MSRVREALAACERSEAALRARTRDAWPVGTTWRVPHGNGALLVEVVGHATFGKAGILVRNLRTDKRRRLTPTTMLDADEVSA